MATKKPVTVIGMGMSPGDLTERHTSLIQSADLLIGGRRHLAHFNHLSVRREPITADIAGLMKKVKRWMKTKRIVVLASGDPLYYGIGQQLIRYLGAEYVDFYPNVTSVAAAFAQAKLPWQNAKTISLHGRQNDIELHKALKKDEIIAVMTDPKRNPAWLAKWMIRHELDDFNMHVCEQLGSRSERCRWLTPADASRKRFAQPNMVILKRVHPPPSPDDVFHIGMPESAYQHHGGLITKAEVRAISLSKLCLAPTHVLWDLGAGSGSIGLEAGLIVNKGSIIAVEKNPERVAHIRANRKRFQIQNLKVIHAVLPGALEGLPQPDRVFVGGGGKSIHQIIKACASVLKPDGKMVINTVLLESVHKVINTLHRSKFNIEVVQVQVSRNRSMPHGIRFEAENPVWIITAAPPVSAPTPKGRRHA